ncbi:hypothetical protein [Kordia sp.]|uniref:hypothetical protein n=1 Tax=Kordia sp. TaxID=1965332 RepID=UPI0025C333C8|nr:hypothetical protein [Kordia sp.]MCH2193258.1 hypothetical protein [Kordia sp.]
MKLPIKMICSVLILFVTSEIYSQIDRSGIRTEFNPFRNNINSLAYTDIPKEETLKSVISKTKGSQFYDETFRQATISNTKNAFKVRYNAFLDEMEILDGDAVVFIDKKHQKHLVSFPTTNIHYKVLKERKDDERIALGYFVQLEENNYLSLYRKDRKKYVAPGSHRPRVNGEFKNARTEFYVETNNSGIAIPLPRKNKDFAALFSTKRAQIEAFIQHENIKVQKEADLIKLIKYINNL